jgi:hypothetical protein
MTTELNEEEKVLAHALVKAKDVFNNHIHEKGLDPAFFSIELHGHRLSQNFESYRHSIKMIDEESDV